MKIIDISKLKPVIEGYYYDIPQTGICRLYGRLFLYMCISDDGFYLVKRATKTEVKMAKKAKKGRGFSRFFLYYITYKLG